MHQWKTPKRVPNEQRHYKHFGHNRRRSHETRVRRIMKNLFLIIYLFICFNNTTKNSWATPLLLLNSKQRQKNQNLKILK